MKDIIERIKAFVLLATRRVIAYLKENKHYYIMLVFLFILTLLFVTIKRDKAEFKKIEITKEDTVKNVSVTTNEGDTLIVFKTDTIIPDADIIEYIKDSIHHDSIYNDSLLNIKFKQLTKRINGGYNGLEGRQKLYERAKEVLR